MGNCSQVLERFDNFADKPFDPNALHTDQPVYRDTNENPAGISAS